MTDLNKQRAKALINNDDKWFAGASQKTSSGETTYFICDHFLDKEIDGVSTKFCRLKNMAIDNIDDVCNLDCDLYGKCDNCRGWTAIRCEACVIPRP